MCFAYDSEHERIAMEERAGSDCSASLSQTTYYLNGSGVRSEKVVAGATTTWHDYLFAGGLTIGERDRVEGGSTTLQYFVLDHLGSVAVVTDASGAVQSNGRLSYDAWGQRRLANGSDGTPAPAPTTRGFTGHEMIDGVGLVNMNGRVYDPYIGRFMSADPVTESVFMMQLLNRYSYVGNNPLSYTDMSGYCFLGLCTIGDVLKIFVAVVAVVVAWEFLPGLLLGSGASMSQAAFMALGGDLAAMGTLAAVGFVSGAAIGAVTTGTLQGALMSGLSGALMGGLAPGLGGYLGGVLGSATASITVASGLIGGLFSVAAGGDFGSGFLAAGFSALAGPYAGGLGQKAGLAAGTVAAAVAGGVASVLGGGKFANGAITGAFAYLATSIGREAKRGVPGERSTNGALAAEGRGEIAVARTSINWFGEVYTEYLDAYNDLDPVSKWSVELHELEHRSYLLANYPVIAHPWVSAEGSASN